MIKVALRTGERVVGETLVTLAIFVFAVPVKETDCPFKVNIKGGLAIEKALLLHFIAVKDTDSTSQ